LYFDEDCYTRPFCFLKDEQRSQKGQKLTKEPRGKSPSLLPKKQQRRSGLSSKNTTKMLLSGTSKDPESKTTKGAHQKKHPKYLLYS